MNGKWLEISFKIRSVRYSEMKGTQRGDQIAEIITNQSQDKKCKNH